MKVLIVDDEKHVRHAVRMLVHWEACGVTEVIEAESGDQAIEVITALSPPVVLTDMRMPGKDGVALMAAVMSTTQLNADMLDKYKTLHTLLGFSLMNICNEFLGNSQTGIAFRHLERMDEIILLYWGEPSRWLNDRPGDAAGEELADEHGSIPALPIDKRGLLSLPLWQKLVENRLLAAGQALTPSHSPSNPVIRDIARYLDAHYDEEISLQDMASRFYLSREYISRKFKQEYGVNLSEYLCRIRMDKAKLLLLNDKLRLHHIAGMVGYQDEKYFGKVFKKLEGVTPGEFRRRHSVDPQPLAHTAHDLPRYH